MVDPFEDFTDTHKPPPLMVENPSFDEKYLQQERIKVYVVRENALRDNVIKVYGLTWRQCTSALQMVIKGVDDYTTMARTHNMVWLLEQIKIITSGIDVKANPHVVLFESLSSLLNMKQQSNESNDRYAERFNSNIQTIELAKGGHLFCSHELLKCDDDENPTI